MEPGGRRLRGRRDPVPLHPGAGPGKSTGRAGGLGENERVSKRKSEIDEGLIDEMDGIPPAATTAAAEEAFCAMVRQRARREEIEALSTMRGMDLDDHETMAAAWRE